MFVLVILGPFGSFGPFLSPFGHLGHLVLEGISFFIIVKIVLLFLFWFLSAPYKTSMADFSKNFQNFKPQLWACNWLLSEINRAKKSHSDLIKLPWKYGFTVKLTLLFYPGGKKTCLASELTTVNYRGHLFSKNGKKWPKWPKMTKMTKITKMTKMTKKTQKDLND